VKRAQVIDETTTPDGRPMRLVRQAGQLMVIVDGVALMGSRLHGSEQALGALAGERLGSRPRPRVLVGGLGMGFTLRAALDALPRGAEVVVSELIPAMVRWSRGADSPLGPLAHHPLDDPRVRLEMGDVGALLKASSGGFDAILLDVDNGPDDLTAASNAWLYQPAGLAAIRAALRPGGFVAVWSAFREGGFERRLSAAGLSAEVIAVRARGAARKGARHVIFVGARGG